MSRFGGPAAGHGVAGEHRAQLLPQPLVLLPHAVDVARPAGRGRVVVGADPEATAAAMDASNGRVPERLEALQAAWRAGRRARGITRITRASRGGTPPVRLRRREIPERALAELARGVVVRDTEQRIAGA